MEHCGSCWSLARVFLVSRSNNPQVAICISHQTCLVCSYDKVVNQLAKSLACQIAHTSIVLPNKVKSMADVAVPTSLMSHGCHAPLAGGLLRPDQLGLDALVSPEGLIDVGCRLVVGERLVSFLGSKFRRNFFREFGYRVPEIVFLRFAFLQCSSK
jgi:hypothetical protein